MRENHWNTNFLIFNCKTWFNYSKWLSFSFVSEHHPILVWKSVDVHRFRSKKILGGAKDICPNFPNLPVTFCGSLPTEFLHKVRDHENLFLVRPPKKGLHVFFWKCWVQFFEIKQRWATFYPNFQRFCSNFRQIKPFGGGLVSPPPMPLVEP